MGNFPSKLCDCQQRYTSPDRSRTPQRLDVALRSSTSPNLPTEHQARSPEVPPASVGVRVTQGALDILRDRLLRKCLVSAGSAFRLGAWDQG
jgi:hypothetical protein